MGDSEFREILVKLSLIDNKLDLLTTRLLNLEKNFEDLSEKTTEIKGSTESMDTHIQFVTDIYEQVKHPFHTAIDMVNKAIGYTEPPLQELTYFEEDHFLGR